MQKKAGNTDAERQAELQQQHTIHRLQQHVIPVLQVTHLLCPPPTQHVIPAQQVTHLLCPPPYIQHAILVLHVTHLLCSPPTHNILLS